MVSPKKGTTTSTLSSAINQNAFFLSDIPYLFFMFSGRKDSANRKQMQIYLQFAKMQLISYGKITNNSETIPNFAPLMIIVTESRYLMSR